MGGGGGNGALGEWGLGGDLGGVGVAMWKGMT